MGTGSSSLTRQLALIPIGHDSKYLNYLLHYWNEIPNDASTTKSDWLSNTQSRALQADSAYLGR